MSEDTTPEVFIIESLHEEDFDSNRVGKVIEQVLIMGAMKPIYRYVKTYQELQMAMQEFHHSNYRYLHLSFHGDEESFETHFGVLPFNQLLPSLNGIVRGKRVFISSCEVVTHVNHELANILIRNAGCVSLVGSYEEIAFNDAALMWSTFYYLCFRDQKDRIKIRREDITGNLKTLTRLFRLNLNYYALSQSQGITLTQFKSGKVWHEDKYQAEPDPLAGELI